ncbi:ABC-2 family transporter protein [Candidatus Burarchaeum australiense]|nr:ABC-2 family transporter protein [Candidatus Burarchaeum australiense]
MSKLLKIALHEYLAQVRRRTFLLVTIGMPALLLFVVGIQMYVAGQVTASEQAGNVGFVDGSGLFQSIEVPAGINLTYYAGAEQATAALLVGSIDYYYLVPVNYLKTGVVARFSTENGFAGILSTSSAKGGDTWIQDSLASKLMKGKLDDETATRVLAPATVVPQRLDANGKPVSENLLQIALPIAFAVAFLIAIFMTSGYLLQGIVAEKENRVMEVLLSSVSTTDLMAGKIIGLGAAGLTQILVWAVAGIVLVLNFVPGSAGVGALFAGMPIPYLNLLLVLVYFVLGYVLFASVYASVGAISTSMREGQQVAGFFAFLSIIPIYFIPIMLKEPDALLAIAFSLFPFTSPLTMVIRTSLSDVPPLEILASLGILMVTIVAIVWATGKIFKMGSLTYGKRPDFRRILAALRED